MSGHSKWASIKHKKGATDAKRGKVFTKIIKEISVAARLGGGDPVANARLRTAILKANSANMPKDNVDRAIKKGTGDLDGVEYSELTYEAYAPGGAALLVDILTDNKNRTAAEIRTTLGKSGGNLGETGCVSYLFKRKGVIALDATQYAEDDIIAIALESGAEDVTNDGETIEVVTDPESFEGVLESLTEGGFEHTVAEVSMVPDATLTLDASKTKKALRLVELLEDNDDVQNVYTNLDIPDGFAFDEG